MHIRRGLTREESTNASQPHNGHDSQNRSTDATTSDRSSGTRRIQRHHCLLALSLRPYSAQNIHVFVLSFATRFSGHFRHFRRIQAVNLEWYTAAQDPNKVLRAHVPRYENGVFQQISRSQISQARSQSEVGLSCESERQKFGTRRIRAEDL
jgi:hypothetical protein